VEVLAFSVRVSIQHLLIILLLFALAGLTPGTKTHVGEPPLPIDAYWREIKETQALVDGLWSEPSETHHAKLLAAADEWENITAVSLDDGTVVLVDHSFLADQLRTDPPDLTRLNRLLAALLACRDAWPQREVTPADMATIDRVLARPEFQWPPKQPSPLEEWWKELQRRLLEFLDKLLPAEAAGVMAPLVRYGLTGLGALALILVLVYAMRGILTDFVSGKEIDADSEDGDQALTAAAALKRAQALSTGGDYRAAVRYLYLSTLLLLEERGLLRYDRSLTNHEYLRSVAHKPELAAVFRDVVEVFDRVWYGYRPLDEASYTQYADQVMELQKQQ
jgi:hypothetical protein